MSRSRTVRRTVAALVAGALLGGATLLVDLPTSSATTPGIQGAIYFANDGGNGIGRINADGTGMVTHVVPASMTWVVGPVSITMRWPDRPALSPDGDILLFDAVVTQGDQAPDDNNREMFAMRLSTGQIDRLRPGQLGTGGRWKPNDGGNGTIAFSANTGHAGPLGRAATAVGIARVSGSPLRMTEPVPITIINTERVARIDWRPDGAALSYTRIYVDPNVSPPQFFSALVLKFASSSGAEVSMAFEHGLDLGQMEIHSSWSPDGRRIVYAGYSRVPEIRNLTLADLDPTGGSAIFGATVSDRDITFAPMNDSGAPGDTFVTDRSGPHILTSSATEGRIRGPLGGGVLQNVHSLFWATQRTPVFLGGISLPVIAAVPTTIPLATSLQPQEVLIKGSLQLCRSLPSICPAPTTTVPAAQ